MAKAIEHLPEITGEEMIYVQQILTPFTDEEARMFSTVYRGRRRDPTLILVLTLIGFFALAGLQRFFTNQIGMGLLYLFTGGLCVIGTIVDAVNYQKLAYEYNSKIAQEIALTVKR